MDELVAWLRAQLDADEEAWRMVDAREVVQMLDGRPIAPQMLADIAAKRRILDWCSERERVYVGGIGSNPEAPRAEDFIDGDFKRHADAFVIRLLALPYADRPGFRDEWRPQ